MDQEYQDYLAMREALLTGELDGKPVGPEDKKIIGSAMTRYESLNPGVREGVIPHGADETPPDPMAVARSDQSDPLGLSAPLPQRAPNVKAKSDEVAAFGGNNGIRADFRDPTRQDFQRRFGHVPSKVELEKFQIEEWNKYAANAAEKGASAERIPDSFSDTNLPKDAPFTQKLREKALTGIDALTAGSHGALSGAIPGAGKLAAYAVGGPQFVHETDSLVERHPVAAAAGGFYGGAGGVASKVAGGVSGGLARLAGKIPLESELLKAAGRTVGAGLGGAAAGATQALGENAAANLTGSDQKVDVADSALFGGAVGAGANVLGEGARAASEAIERGKFGPGLRAGEELGGRPTLTGYKIAPGSELEGLEKSRVEGRLGSTADVAAERLAPKYAESGRNITQRVNDRAANESAAMRESQNTALFANIDDPVPYEEAATRAGSVINSHPDYPSVERFLNRDRAAVSKFERGLGPQTGQRADELRAVAEGTNRALGDAAQGGGRYPGMVSRIQGMSPEELEDLEKSQVARNQNIWSTATDPDAAEASTTFTKADPGKSPVRLEIRQNSAVPTDAIQDSNTYREALIPSGKAFRVTGSRTESPDGVVTSVPGYEGTRVVSLHEAAPRKVSLEPVLKAAAEELQGPNVLPDGPLRNIVRGVASNPEVTVEEWERLVGQIDQLANLDKAKGVVDPRIARISAAMREAGEGFPGLNEMRAGQAERFQKNELTMKHGGLPLRSNKEVPEWQNMTADEQKQLYGTLRNQTGDIHGTTHDPASSVPMVRRAMDEIASDAGLKAELDKIPKLEAIDQVRQASRPHGLGVRLHPGGATASAFGKALEFGEIRGYPTLKALGSVPPSSDIVGILSKSPKTLELLRRMRTGQDLGQGKLANRLGLRGGAIAGKITAARDEITDEDIENLKKLQSAVGTEAP